MTSVGSASSVRIPGLATGMDTDTMIKDMLSGEQQKIDKAKQKQQTVKWQQEIYREVMKDIKSLQDKYFSVTSPNSIMSSSAWNTLTIGSSNENVITASGSAGANRVDYSFNVVKLAQSAKMSSSKATNNVDIKKDSSLESLGLGGEQKFSIKFGDGDKEVSKEITIRTEPLYEKDSDGNFVLDEDGNKVVKEPADTVETLIKKINDSTDGNVKASYSSMTGEFTIQSTKTGENSKLQIVDASGNESGALDFLGISRSEKGSNSQIEVKAKDGSFTKTLNEESNSFSIDGITYNVHTTGTCEITSREDVKPVVDNMKKFVEDYNKIMDKVYSLVTEKGNKDYQPLTEAQKKDMSEEEIERWEKKAKEGLLRNDSEMRSFMDKMQNSIFGDNMTFLMECGLTSSEDYTKKGQLSLDEDKFKKALQNNSQKVYDAFAGGNDSVLEKMKDTMYDYVGTSSSVFAKKAGLEKTSSVVNNFYSEQIKRQEDAIKLLQRKMDDRENKLYKQFGQLEASMNKLNSQMNYFAQM
ncbi:flagellar filament capping protein FliD [Paraclostridium bifermentans]|jgi:flagellar capping protein FliD|uniref:flagellar filament capping protein FliD n=1 Tax=Paraclostridium bifermentans TaxID=1490 RepID=UPI000DF744B0|nr:flagellar filament capping protein FliD [Paraclostridium bifermentans]MBS5953026.1 flagellar filament capping protein FliD [Paraclostridium bifermentans]MBU5287461.1 flagellar filament capping protein FliD [Paraclostridium bifermentans]MDB8986912.1 flagellar filament capping protein FliD [Parabacteroides merdae]RDC49776.1 flagellar cap protein FliD [Acinetobacter sp. RIT592]